jgi:ABC-type transporter Mla maintaining outer membrane lipid asymmetry ATPase subunit MlaF
VTAPLQFDRLEVGRRGRTTELSLAVAAHQTVAILGDEESGVDQLGAYALGLERPAAGLVRVFETVLPDLPSQARFAFRRRIGYLPAGDGLLQNLSLRDNIALPLRFGSDAAPRDIDGRVNIMVVAVRLGAAADLRPARATEEERRRAALARAIAFDPSVLVLEQPFDGITARAAGELLEVARGGETPEGGRRAVLITGQEIPVVVQRRCDRVYRLTRTGALEMETV